MTSVTMAGAENAAVRAASDVPELVSNLEAVNSPLAAQLTGKALIASKTPWGTVLVPFVAWIAMRYGLGWTPELDTAVAGVLVLLCSFVMRLLTSAPITGLFHAKPALAIPPVTPAEPPPTPQMANQAIPLITPGDAP